MVFTLQFIKGHYSINIVDGGMVFASARRLILLYICSRFSKIISKGFKNIERTRFLHCNLQRGIIL